MADECGWIPESALELRFTAPTGGSTFSNIGIDYYLSNDIVLDIRAGIGLTTDSDDFFAGVGGGLRF